MKILYITFLFVGIFCNSYAQSIVIGTGAEINVTTGADICATSTGNISGNLTGDGTQCGGAAGGGEETYDEQGGYALKFNGTTDYVNIPYHSSLDFGAGNFTIEVWVKRSELNARHNILEKNASDKVITFYIGSDNKIYATTYDGSNSTGIISNSTVGTNWTHISFVRNGTTHSLYINGKLDNSIEGTARNFNVDAPLNIGRFPGDGFYFNGLLDEIRIWNFVRTETEIKTTMYREVNPSTNLKAYYKMSDGTGTTLSDNGGYTSNHGTLTGNPTWKTSGAFSGSKNALDFDGTDDYVSIPDHYSLDVTKMTLEMWFNWTGSGIQFLIGKAIEQMELHTTSTLGMRFIPTTLVHLDTEANIFTTNRWYHIAFIYDPSISLAKFYLDGIEKPLTLSNGDLTTAVANSASPVSLARRGDNSYKYSGKLDEVRIWNAVRAETEIRDNMFRTLSGKETALSAYYRMDYYDGTTLADNSINGNNGTLTNMDAATDWVVSNVFNTWIGSENTDWTNSANWSSGSVPSATDNVGIYKLNLANETTISGTPTVNHLLFSSTAAPTLSSNFNVNGNLLLEKNIDLNGKTITLGSTGYLSEGSYRLFGATGTIQTTRELNNINENIAGLGIKITEDGNLGNTTIIRGHESKGSNAIQRHYQITTANSPTSADLIFYYNDNELNGITEANLKLFKSVDGSTWGVESSSSVNTTDNTISLLGLNSFSYWAAGDGNSPLPVELTSFTAASTSSAT
ncbi:MAG: LamG domain-containing protein, partial [Ignavibacteriaceae bacterium]|nr:LamG domain-containing protein [Ignavibacteriaceae bacterium]